MDGDSNPFHGTRYLDKIGGLKKFSHTQVNIHNTKNAMQANGLFVKTIMMEC